MNSHRSLAALAVAFALAAAVFHFVARVEAHRDETAAKVVDAAHATQELAARMAICSERARALPATSNKAPATLPRGVAVWATAHDWEDPAFRCAGFERLDSMSFQVQWVRYPSPTAGDFSSRGVARAESDLDGDGTVDHVAETEVACNAEVCLMSPSVELRIVR